MTKEEKIELTKLDNGVFGFKNESDTTMYVKMESTNDGQGFKLGQPMCTKPCFCTGACMKDPYEEASDLSNVDFSELKTITNLNFKPWAQE